MFQLLNELSDYVDEQPEEVRGQLALLALGYVLSMALRFWSSDQLAELRAWPRSDDEDDDDERPPAGREMVFSPLPLKRVEGENEFSARVRVDFQPRRLLFTCLDPKALEGCNVVSVRNEPGDRDSIDLLFRSPTPAADFLPGAFGGQLNGSVMQPDETLVVELDREPPANLQAIVLGIELPGAEQ